MINFSKLTDRTTYSLGQSPISAFFDGCKEFPERLIAVAHANVSCPVLVG